MRILTATQCTGKLHIGNIVSTILPTVKLSEDEKNDIFVFLADLHSLTTIKNAKELEENRYYAAACGLALGLDPQKVIFYRQSKMRGICDLMWILNCLTPYPMLANAHAFKSKSEKLSDVNVGLFDYPVLMTADILLFQGELIPLGKDNKQHVEITRDIAKKFNDTFGDIFVLPEALIDEKIQLIPGIDGQKMSKSYNNTIDIFAQEDILHKKIMSIKTDCKKPNEPKNPEECIIFNIYKSIASNEEINELKKRYLFGEIDYKSAKELLFETILKVFSEAREKFEQIKNDKAFIENIFTQGEKKAQEIADETIVKIKKALLI